MYEYLKIKPKRGAPICASLFLYPRMYYYFRPHDFAMSAGKECGRLRWDFISPV